MTPVEELRAAAQKVREARRAVHAAESIPADEIGDWTKYYGRETSHGLPSGDAPWIALMHPGLAEPLATWLDGCEDDLAGALHAFPSADEEADLDDLIGLCDEPDSVRRALDLARLLNGDAR